MLIEHHCTRLGHVYRATSKIVGVKIGTCETGSGDVVLIDLANGKTVGRDMKA